MSFFTLIGMTPAEVVRWLFIRFALFLGVGLAAIGYGLAIQSFPTEGEANSAKPASLLLPPSPEVVPSRIEEPGIGDKPIEELYVSAKGGAVSAMEELGRRLLQGAGAVKDPQAGADWLLRAATLGSAQSAFNVGVMYERGFVLERDSLKAAEWYRKAANAGLPTAEHNLALLLRDGKGTARDVKAAIQLLMSAAHQGMAASMFTLGDIYESGDGGTKDPAAALAWFAVAGEYERQTRRDAESTIGKAAALRAAAIKPLLTPEELERAQEIGQREFKEIVAGLSLSSTAAPASSAPAPIVTSASPSAPREDETFWPSSQPDQIRLIQTLLSELRLYTKPIDGLPSIDTTIAIRDFQRMSGLRETGEPSKDLFDALKAMRKLMKPETKQ